MHAPACAAALLMQQLNDQTTNAPGARFPDTEEDIMLAQSQQYTKAVQLGQHEQKVADLVQGVKGPFQGIQV